MSAGPRTIARDPYCLPGDALHHHFPSSFFIHLPLKSGVLLSRLLLFAFHCYRARTNILPLLGADLRRAFHHHPGAQPSSVHQQQPPPPTFAHIMLLWRSGSLCSPLSLQIEDPFVKGGLEEPAVAPDSKPADHGPTNQWCSSPAPPRIRVQILNHPRVRNVSKGKPDLESGSSSRPQPEEGGVTNQGADQQKGHTEVTEDGHVLLVPSELFVNEDV